MNRLRQAYIWCRRICHSRGFGIQSPTDYYFVRYVINEHWPYHAYDLIPHEKDRVLQKQGRLYLRLANFRQPSVIIDTVGVAPYLNAGCRKAQVVTAPTDRPIEMAVAPIDCDYQALFDLCDEQSVLVFHDICHNHRLWRAILKDKRAHITFDLYYCGIVLFDTRRSHHHYNINF